MPDWLYNHVAWMNENISIERWLALWYFIGAIEIGIYIERFWNE